MKAQRKKVTGDREASLSQLNEDEEKEHSRRSRSICTSRETLSGIAHSLVFTKETNSSWSV